MKYLLKFNTKERLEDIQNGSLWFSPNFKFRDIELKEGIIGQGDKNDAKIVLQGDARFEAENYANSVNNITIAMAFGNIGNIPTICFTCIEDSDCKNGKIIYCKEKLQQFKNEFPSYDHVLIIRNPSTFINQVEKELEAYGHNVFYVTDKKLYISIIDFLKEGQEVVIDGNKTQFIINDKNLHKTVFIKDSRFKQQQEFRFVLPKKRIETPMSYKIEKIKDTQIFEINKLLDGIS